MNRCSAYRQAKLDRMNAEDILRDLAYREVLRDREVTKKLIRARALRDARLARMNAEDIARDRAYRQAQRSRCGRSL